MDAHSSVNQGFSSPSSSPNRSKAHPNYTESREIHAAIPEEMLLTYSPIHSRQSSGQRSQTVGPFVVNKRRVESPALGRGSSPYAQPSYPPRPRLSSPSPNSPKRSPFPLRPSANVSISPHSEGLEIVHIEERPEATTHKDTFGSHTVYTFRVRLIAGQRLCRGI